MTETFLIILAGGILLSAVVSDPKLVTLLWLRLGGIVSLSLIAVAGVVWLGKDPAVTPTQKILYAALIGVNLAQLAFVQLAFRQTQRVLAFAGFVLAVGLSTLLLPTEFPRGGVALSCLGATVAGLALMDMLLGHAYLTAWAMKIEPFRRLNLALAVAMGFRTIVAIGIVMAIQSFQPVEMLWGKYGLYILTRWLVGLALPAVFVFMAHDCIKRKSTQSATGILYVAGVLLFIGEIISLQLASETGLPF